MQNFDNRNTLLTIVGIESSCDETALAIIRGKKGELPEILAEILFSQTHYHTPYGGVVPEIAARAHAERIPCLLNEVFKQANITMNDVTAVAATSEPGLIGGVLVGLMVAKGLCVAHNKPFLAINHLEGHALSPRIKSELKFPYLLLLTSGGHCQILIVYNIGHYELIGSTIDDAAGEAFDKIAKILDLGMPGGPEIEKLANKGNSSFYDLPRPLKGSSNHNFSFSGLKTAVKRIVDQNNNLNIPDLCASFQKAVADCFVDRVEKSMNLFKQKTNCKKYRFVVAGGVAANQFIQSSLRNLCHKNNFEFYTPPMKYCTDNGVMIAYAGLERYFLDYESNLSCAAKARSPLGI